MLDLLKDRAKRQELMELLLEAGKAKVSRPSGLQQRVGNAAKRYSAV